MIQSLQAWQVVGVEPAEDYDVYDIEVENSHNFFVECINVHNSAEPK